MPPAGYRQHATISLKDAEGVDGWPVSTNQSGELEAVTTVLETNGGPLSMCTHQAFILTHICDYG